MFERVSRGRVAASCGLVAWALELGAGGAARAQEAGAGPSDAGPDERPRALETPLEGFGPEALDALGELTPEEQARLLEGGLITRAVEFEHKGSTYAGGLSYALVRAAPLEVLSALREPGALREALPGTVEARIVGERDGVTRVTFTQGSPPMVGRYSVQLRWEPGQGRARFWLDPRRPHDLADIWGYLRVVELRPGRTLVTWAVAFDLGQGVFGNVFERPVQKVALRAPSTIRSYVEKSRGERAGAAPAAGGPR